MVSMSASISEGAVADFSKVLAQYRESLGRQAQTAPRRAAIQLCKTFRSQTRKAPKFPRSSEWSASPSDRTPKHITKNGRDMRRYAVNRTARGKQYEIYVYSQMKTSKRGRMSANRAAEKREVRKTLALFHQGLAKQSWGWCMHNIFTGAAPDTPWKRRKKDRRDPKDACRDSTSRSSSSAFEDKGFAHIANRLDYVAAALKISVDAAIARLMGWMSGQIKRVRPKI